MIEVDIPGGKVTLREVDDIRVRQRRIIQKAAFRAKDVIQRLPDGIEKLSRTEQAKILEKMEMSDTDAELLDEVQDATILALVDSWTLERPKPTTMDEIQDLPGSLYDALADVTSKIGATVAGKSFAPDPDQSSPTGPSRDSASLLREETPALTTK